MYHYHSTHICIWIWLGYGPLTRYAKLRVTHICREHFPRHRRVALPTCITAREWPDKHDWNGFTVGGGGICLCGHLPQLNSVGSGVDWVTGLFSHVITICSEIITVCRTSTLPVLYQHIVRTCCSITMITRAKACPLCWNLDAFVTVLQLIFFNSTSFTFLQHTGTLRPWRMQPGCSATLVIPKGIWCSAPARCSCTYLQHVSMGLCTGI